MPDNKSELRRFEYEHVVILKRRTVSATIEEENHNRAFSYSKHDHKRAYFTLTDNFVYREELGRKTLYHPANTILWRPAGISHADSMKHKNGCSFSVFLGDSGLQTLSDYAQIPNEFSEHNSYLVFLAGRLHHEFKNWDSCSPLVSEGLVLEMIGRAAKFRHRVRKEPPKWLKDVVEILDCDFADKQTNRKLADIVAIHPIHLARIFRQFYGCSIGEYVKKKRVEFATGLLIKKEVPLAEIAYASGFSDQSQFTRVFKAETGVTPGNFRDEL